MTIRERMELEDEKSIPARVECKYDRFYPCGWGCDNKDCEYYKEENPNEE